MSPLMPRILGGASILLGVSAIILFNMLMASKEANGMLQGEIDEAVAVNARQKETIDFLQERRAQDEALLEAERLRAQGYVDRLVDATRQLGEEQQDFQRRLTAARKELSDEELVCSEQTVPIGFIRSLHGRPGSITRPGDR